MSLVEPKVFLRLGSHAEKEYVVKTLNRFDGLMVGANLVEVTPGATATLIVKLCSESKGVPYVLDPMTYAFGAYIDPGTGEKRTDLDWIKSDQKIRGQKGKTRRAIKGSYRKLAAAFGTIFESACETGRAIEPDALDSASTRSKVCESVLNYQLSSVRDVFSSDSEYKDLADQVRKPEYLFAPYFYVEPSKKKEWCRVSWLLAKEAASKSVSVPVHTVLCAPREFLSENDFLEEVISELPKTRISGVWLWFSQFDEHFASKVELANLIRLVVALAPSMRVFNLHGGFFSLALSRFGMAGTAHGVGYGEQKDVVPVVGQSIPTVRYYLPALCARFGVPDIERCFTTIGVQTPDDFFRVVCDCAVCRGVIASNLQNFQEFGELHYSTPSSRRAAQTPAAAKRCRFHFLLNRSRERDWVIGKSNDAVVAELIGKASLWKRTVLDAQARQVELWANILASQ